jgi:sortase family protein
VPILFLAAGGYLLATATGSKAHDQPLPRHEFGPGTRDAHPVISATVPAAIPHHPPKNQLSVPALGISAPVMESALHDHLLALPDDVHRVARWTGGAGLHDPQGTVLIAGHVDNRDQGKGALWPLYTAEPGNSVLITDSSGTVTRWTVTGLRSVLKTHLPQEIFTRAGPRRLVIVTCGGKLVRSDAGNYYQDNVVLTARPD